MSEGKKSGSSARDFKRHGTRYKARRRAADILFEAEIRDIDPVAILIDRITLSRDIANAVAPVNPYTKVVVEGVAQELDRIDSIIAAHLSEDWELDRIAAVDRAILRVAVWELLYNEEVPVATAVVEAVEIASQYSGDAAPAYIHGVLDSMAKGIDSLREDSVVTPLEDDVTSDASADDEATAPSDLITPDDLDDSAESDDEDDDIQ